MILFLPLFYHSDTEDVTFWDHTVFLSYCILILTLNAERIFLTQMVWFRENWYEEVLRQLKQGLAKCHAVAFENRGAGESSNLDEAGVQSR